MAREGQIYTLGRWRTKAGMEAEFIRVWQAFADWTSASQSGAGEGTLLQHEDTPQRFVSFGPWDDAASVSSWRQRPEFKDFLAKAQELCDEIEPQNMILVGRSSSAALDD